MVAVTIAPLARVSSWSAGVWAGPWSPTDGVAPLRDSLVLTAMTERRELVDALSNEPTITDLYLGDNLTTRLRPGVPHDSYLGEFLMRTEGMIRSAATASGSVARFR